MTKEETIENLKILKEDYWDDDGYGHETKQYDDTIFALDMAIKALELEQEPCPDAISRQYLIDIATKDGAYDYVSAQEIANAPSVNPQPKTGHWIFDEILDKHYYCSECKSMGVDYWDYCPYCGCRMVEPQESEE